MAEAAQEAQEAAPNAAVDLATYDWKDMVLRVPITDLLHIYTDRFFNNPHLCDWMKLRRHVCVLGAGTCGVCPGMIQKRYRTANEGAP